MKKSSRRMSPKLRANFKGPAVQHYIQALRSSPSPGALVLPPPEYQEIVAAGKSAVPFLINHLSSEDEIQREAAWRAIGQITNKTFIAYHEAFGERNDPHKWREAVANYQSWWEHNRDKSRVQWLLEDLSSSDVTTKKSAIVELGSLGDSSAIPALRKSLDDKRVQFYAASSLARLGDPAAIPYLIDLYLTHDIAVFRRDGICFLYKLTRHTFDFDPEGSQSSRNASIQTWRTWWHKNRNHLTL